MKKANLERGKKKLSSSLEISLINLLWHNLVLLKGNFVLKDKVI